jgi:hypothetical protein
MPPTTFMETRTMTSRNEINDLHADDIAGLRLSTRQVTRAAEIARAKYLAGYCEGFGRRVHQAFRSVNDLFSFAQQANQAARL